MRVASNTHPRPLFHRKPTAEIVTGAAHQARLDDCIRNDVFENVPAAVRPHACESARCQKPPSLAI
jgi:hypothetical protein